MFTIYPWVEKATRHTPEPIEVGGPLKGVLCTLIDQKYTEFWVTSTILATFSDFPYKQVLCTHRKKETPARRKGCFLPSRGVVWRTG